eukprot:8802385-Alexandrium_andersonii.AAC.1
MYRKAMRACVPAFVLAPRHGPWYGAPARVLHGGGTTHRPQQGPHMRAWLKNFAHAHTFFTY